MAVQAKFVADFSDFATAVEKSKVQLRDWQGSIGNVDRDLKKMAAGFEGDKILKEATLAAKAVESIGGASKLTAKEQASLNALVTEAIAKYDALGKEAPADLKKLQVETEKQTSLFSKVKDAVGPLGAAIAGAFTVTAIISAGKKVIDFADQLTNLSNKTGISTDRLQEFQLAFEPAGVSIDTVATNVTKLAKNLIGDDKAAVGALEKLGLSVKDLKTLAPEDQFLKVADAVGGIASPTEKAYAAMAIFGKGGAELLQGLDGHLGDTTQKFRDMGLIIDKETVKAADDFGDKLGAIGIQMIAILAKAIGPMLPALSALADAFSVVANVVGQVLGVALKVVTVAILGLYTTIADLLAFLGEMAQKIPIVGEKMGFLSSATDWLHKSAEKASLMIGDLVVGTTASAKAATVATPALIGLGEAHEKAAKEAKGQAKALAEELNPALQLFYATVGQDIILQNAAKHVAQFTEPFKDLTTAVNSNRAVLEQYMVLWERVSVSVSASAEDMEKHATGAIEGLTDGFKKGLSDLWKGMSGGQGFAGLMSNLGAGIVTGFGNILSGGLTKVIDMGISLAVKGVEKLASIIGGLFDSEETKKVNKPRDDFFAQFGGYQGLANDLTQALGEQGDTDSGGHASDLIKTLYDAKTQDNFRSAERAIASVFSASGRDVKLFRQGTQGRYLDFGAGTPAMLHGKERVSTEAEGQAESATVKELRELRALFLDLPRAIAVQTADRRALA